MLQSKLPSELNLFVSRRFNDLDFWEVSQVFKVFKEELSAREKTFSLESGNTNYTASSLFTANHKVKKILTFHACFAHKNHKSQRCKMVMHVRGVSRDFEKGGRSMLATIVDRRRKF